MIHWLESIPALAIYLSVGLIIGLESLGIPLPGEIVLVSASVAASQGLANPLWLGVFAATGAIVGDSVGYMIGRRHGRRLLDWLGKRFPKHLGPDKVAQAEGAFARWGVGAVFGGRFVALLRILAGPLAGVLGMRYGWFLAANAAGGVLWAGTVTSVAYIFGVVAEKWIKGFSWVGLAITVAISIGIMLYMRRKAAQSMAANSSKKSTNHAETEAEADAA